MKIELPVWPRLVTPIIAVLLLADAVLLGITALAVSRTVDRVRFVDAESHVCLTYSTRWWGADYITMRCVVKD